MCVIIFVTQGPYFPAPKRQLAAEFKASMMILK